MKNEKEREYQELLLRLQATQEELRQHVSVVKKNEQWLAALNSISGLITQSPEIHHVFALVAGKAMEVMGVDTIRIYLLNEESQELLLEISEGVSEEFVAEVRRIKVGEGCNGTVAQTGKPLIIQDITTNSPFGRQMLVTEGIRSQLVVPLQSKGRVIGTLCVAKRTPGKFHADEVSLLSSIGNAIVAGVENTRLYQNMKQALTQLGQSEERYRDLFENAYDAIWVHDLEGNMVAANKACKTLTRYSTEDLMNLNICQLMSDDSRSCIGQIEQGLLQDKPVDHRYEGELVKKEGTKAVVQVTTSLVIHEGQAVGFQHAARDVTEERRMQESLSYYLQQVTRAQEEERKRIARELHDETLQNLIVISRQLDKITSSEALWEVSLEVVRGLKKQIEAAVQGIRRFSHDLRPLVLDDLGLLPALELLADDLQKQGITTIFKVIGKARRLPPELETMLFRITQEATRNIWRHSQASAAELVIEFRDSKARLSIRDNGKGFNLPQRPGDLAILGKLGLAGMHERARLLGGSLILESRPDKGTMITVEAPI